MMDIPNHVLKRLTLHINRKDRYNKCVQVQLCHLVGTYADVFDCTGMDHNLSDRLLFDR